MQLIGMSEAARQLKVHPNTILVWERKGVVQPMRDSANRRLFTEAQIEELREMRARRRPGSRMQ